MIINLRRLRVGSTNRVANAAMLNAMNRFSLGEAYDEQAIPALNSEAFDFRVASESFADIRSLKRAITLAISASCCSRDTNKRRSSYRLLSDWCSNSDSFLR